MIAIQTPPMQKRTRCICSALLCGHEHTCMANAVNVNVKSEKNKFHNGPEFYEQQRELIKKIQMRYNFFP